KFEAAKADVRLKDTLIEVARKDRDEAQALADYSKVTAPFDGVITQRNVNPGSFVQNASTGRTGTLLRVERRDIVTVRTKIPDNFAPYVSENTEVILELSELPGVKTHGKVTRFAPTLESETHDRSMIVQVDLFNGTEAEYRAFMAKE